MQTSQSDYSGHSSICVGQKQASKMSSGPMRPVYKWKATIAFVAVNVESLRGTNHTVVYTYIMYIHAHATCALLCIPGSPSNQSNRKTGSVE